MPWSTRARKSTSSVPATPISRDATTLPASEMRITGRRPWWSERRPQTGAKMSCITAYEAVISPIWTGEAPKSSAQSGQDRQHDPEADQVDQDRREDDPERGEEEREPVPIPTRARHWVRPRR